MDRRLSLLLLLCGFLVVALQAVEAKLVTYCDSPHGSIQSVAISNCQLTDRFCKFHKNTNVSINVQFVPNYAATSVDTKITGDLGGVPIPFPVSPSQACGNYGLTCPLTAGQLATFQMEMPIKPIYPNVAVVVTIKLVDDSKTNVACLKFNAQITQ